MTTSKNTQIIEAKVKGFDKAKGKIKGVDKSLKGMAKAALTAGAALYGAKKLLDGMKEECLKCIYMEKLIFNLNS